MTALCPARSISTRLPCMQAFTVFPLTLWLASLVAALSGRPGQPPLTDKQRKLVITLHVRCLEIYRP